MSEVANSFVIAQWPAAIFDLFRKIISGDVERKGKNLPVFKVPIYVTHFRQLTSKFTWEEHARLLTDVIEGRTTPSEMGTKAVKMRQNKKVVKFLMTDLGIKDLDQDELKRKFPNMARASEINQWMKNACELKIKDDSRPRGWSAWIDKGKRYAEKEKHIEDSAKVKVFTFRGADYTFHANSVGNTFSLLGNPPRNYGFFFLFVD